MKQNEIRTGKEIIEELHYDTSKAEEIVRKKKQYQHTRTDDLENGCPIGGFIPRTCWDCTYTDMVGMCCHPVDIQKEITEGRAQPLIHNHRWPELEADYKRRMDAVAFRVVDRR